MISPDRPLISVIVPVYNAENYITGCLDSILSQTFRNFECILVDDGSTDKSLSICNSYSQSDKRIKVIHKNNAGVSSARNTGLNNSLGEYLAFVDSDDLVLPEMYKTLYNNIVSKQYDAVICGFIHQNYTHSVKNIEFNTSQAEMVFFLENAGLFGTVWNKLYKKDIINKYNIVFPTGYFFGEDFLFNLSYFSFVKTAICIKDVLYIYNINEKSVSKKRPTLDQSLFRFKNVNEQILQLTENPGGLFHNRILALDFTYTIFLIRNLYIPSIYPGYKRFKLLSDIKYFYLKNKAFCFFRSFRYRFFYLFFIHFPLLMFDSLCFLFFSLIYLKRKYS